MMVRRVAVAVLDSDLHLEPELAAVFRGRLPIHVGRVEYPGEVRTESLAAAEQALSETARLLQRTGPDLMVYGCTSGSFYGGDDHLARLRERVGQVVDAPVVTASDAIVQALARLGVRRVGLVSPYSTEITEQLVGFLARRRVAVAGTELLFGDRRVDDTELQSLGAEDLAAACERVTADADAVLVSCTGMALLASAELIESRIGVPVVSSNLAIARLLLDLSGQSGPADCGTLLGLPTAGESR